METVLIDDRELRLYVAAPDSGSQPGVLLLHPWWGFNDRMRDVSD